MHGWKMRAFQKNHSVPRSKSSPALTERRKSGEISRGNSTASRGSLTLNRRRTDCCSTKRAKTCSKPSCGYRRAPSRERSRSSPAASRNLSVSSTSPTQRTAPSPWSCSTGLSKPNCAISPGRSRGMCSAAAIRSRIDLWRRKIPRPLRLHLGPLHLRKRPPGIA